MQFSQNRSYSAGAFGVATFIISLLTAHSYIISSYATEPVQGPDYLLRTAVTWYLWAAAFPLIYRMAAAFHFAGKTKIKSLLVHLIAGTGAALLHATIQVWLNDRLLTSQSNPDSISNALQSAFTSTLLWRFFVYQTLVVICIALDAYRRAREMEIRASQIEAAILQAQIECVKMKLDPEFVFKSLKQLSALMHVDLDEAESMTAQLGDYLRIRLDHSRNFRWEAPEKAGTAIHAMNINNEAVNNLNLRSNPAQKWLLILGIFTGLAIYFTIHRMIAYGVRGIEMNWAQQLLDCTGWYIWALITPVVLRLASRFPLQKGSWHKNVTVHLLFFIILWFAATLSWEGVKWASNLGSYSYLHTLPMQIARSPFSLDIICYGTILAMESGLRYHRQFESGRRRTSRLAAQLANARLQALQMQLHPHFLFNALNSLSELMREDPASAEEMISNLEKFLRLTMDQNDAYEIPLERELEFLTCYLAIEHVRFQQRLVIAMEIEPRALEASVPNLILQPIVENAVRHGVAPRSSPGRIEIQATSDNGALKISIRDDGPGLNSRARRLRPQTGLGLSNTRERLAQLYGDSHRFELINAPEGGLIVSLEIPLSTVT